VAIWLLIWRINMWVLLEYWNDYNQHGGYFVGIFVSKKSALNAVHHVGRRDYEDTWYEIEKVIVNKVYEQEED